MINLKGVTHKNRLQPIVRIVDVDRPTPYAWIDSAEMLYYGQLSDGNRVYYPEIARALEAEGELAQFHTLQLHKALNQCRLFEAERLALRVHVNVTPDYLESGMLYAVLSKALTRAASVHPWRLVIEITESAAWKDLRTAQARLAELRKLGVGIALDDLGAGRSLELIQVGEWDTLKIDLALTRAVAEFDSAKLLAQNLLRLAAAHKADVIVEGVEAGDDLKWWLDQGVRRFQSFAFAKPIDAHKALSKFIELAPSIPLLELP